MSVSIDDFYADLPALLQAQDRAGNRIVIAVCLDHLAGSQFDRHWGDMDCVIEVYGLCERRDSPGE